VVANLRAIAAAQQQFRSIGLADADEDGLGEYGFLAELSGAVPVRGAGLSVSPPLLDERFQVIQNGCAEKSGYLYRVDLPGADGQPIPEASKGGAPQRVPAAGGELGFVVYAWPREIGSTGTRVFVVDETGEIFVSDNAGPQQGYSGWERTPAGDASFLIRNNNRERGRRSVRRGQDGALWLREDL